jgi:hypothetical protein
MILKMLLVVENFHQYELAQRLLSFGIDGVSVFQGIQTHVIMELHHQDVPFMVKVHCMAHYTN